jgi:hypothetical protein
MSNKIKILLTLLIVAIILVFYLVIKSKPLSRIPEQPNEQTRKVDLKQLESDYKSEAKGILNDYSLLISKENLKVEEVKIIRDRLLGLKVPAEFKDLHLNLVLALAKMSESVNEAEVKEKEASAKLIQDLKAKYVWLN